MNNGLSQLLYAPYTQPNQPAANGGGSTLGGSFGFNVGSETFRVQLAIGGILLAAVVGLFLLHRSGIRFHTTV